MNESAHQARRCPKCLWCLYDGVWGQNPDCTCYGKRIRKVVLMTNEEAFEKFTLDKKK